MHAVRLKRVYFKIPVLVSADTEQYQQVYDNVICEEIHLTSGNITTHHTIHQTHPVDSYSVCQKMFHQKFNY